MYKKYGRLIKDYSRDDEEEKDADEGDPVLHFSSEMSIAV